MKIDGLLPIGSVVLLKNSTKRVMIIGVCQASVGAEGRKVYDYSGCLFPEGYMGAERNFLFNQDQIDKLYFLGYQDDEQLAFKEKADALLADVRAKEA
ncbi:MAG: DUF4176 domain-containing protein [Clostridia bacterium]|nr:DUF4176 domain-containing protein [Clostridia bacterium]